MSHDSMKCGKTTLFPPPVSQVKKLAGKRCVARSAEPSQQPSLWAQE